jgi:osmoprotectant transport system ATP-binding protein
MVEYVNVTKSYDGGVNVVENLNLNIKDGEFVVLVGESGCGKTTTMKMLNRLIDPTSGEILIDGKNIMDIDKISLRRSIGYVIQDVGLFPHHTIERNIRTIPDLCKADKNETDKKVKELMELVGLPYEDYAHRFPSELSGGQRQRVGVARALANNPDIILMDEPFSALDPITRNQLQDEILSLHEDLNKTIIFVTHDVDEAIKLGDRIAVMLDGEIVQIGTPEEILKQPTNDFVENFVGKDRLWKTPDMLTAADVMRKDVPMINPDRSVAQAIEIMKKTNSPVLAIVKNKTEDDRKLLGLIGANRFRGISDHSIKMKDLMKTNYSKIAKDTCLTEVISIRESDGVRFSPVTNDKGSIIGIITDTSILNVLSEYMPGKEDY